MVRINDTDYDAIVVVAKDGTMSVSFNGTTQTLSDVQALFNSTPKVEIWEDNELAATYFNKEVTSITARKSGSLYDITIYLVVSKLEESAETVLQTQINNLMSTVDTIQENNTATDNAVDDLGTVASENTSTIEELAVAIDDLATLVSELVENSGTNAETTPSDTAPSTETTDSTDTGDESTDSSTTETTTEEV